MKQILLLTVIFCLSFVAGAQTLGNYSAATVVAGHNINVTPSSAPSGASKVIVNTSTSFHGGLTVNPSSGTVSIIDARPAGLYTIKIRAYNNAGASTTKIFNLNVQSPGCSLGDFIDTNQVTTGLNQLNVAIGDFNRDGKQDIAAAHEGGVNTISIRLGNGNGYFTGTLEVPVGSHPFNLAIGDFNSDGKQDIVVVNSGDNSVTPLIGNGTGGFTVMQVADVNPEPVSIVVGDFNGDGNQDFATANLNANTVSVRNGNGTGFFNGITEVPVGLEPYTIALGDFNNDGKADFVTANSAANSVSVRFGNGMGNFTGSNDIQVGMNPTCVVVNDFNHDGKQDFATANYLDNTISVCLGNGLGGFSANVDYPVGHNPYYLVTGNFNGDQHTDLAITNYFDNTVSIRYGDGIGGFNGNRELAIGSYPIGLAAGDFNNDNLMDLVVSNHFTGSVAVRLGITSPVIIDSASNTGPYCEGQPIYLNAPGGNIFSWTGPNGFFSSTQYTSKPVSVLSDSGNYMITITDSANCTGSATTRVVVNPLPVVSFSLSDDTMCYGSTGQVLSGGTPANGIYMGTGVINNSYFDSNVSGPGEFNIIYQYTDTNDCVNTATQKMFVLICEGTEERSFEKGFSVFPNPVSDQMTISCPPGVKYYARIYSIDGKLLSGWVVNEDPVSIEDFEPGCYFIKIFGQSETVTRHIIKTK